MPRSLKSKSCSWRIRKTVKTFSSAHQRFLNVPAAYLPVIGAVQIVGHCWILCCQCVDLRWERTVILRSAGSFSHGQSHLFDPGLDAMIQPQSSGFSLAGAQNLTNLTVREAVLFGLQQQLRWYRNTAGSRRKKRKLMNTSAALTSPKPTFVWFTKLTELIEIYWSHFFPVNVPYGNLRQSIFHNSGVVDCLLSVCFQPLLFCCSDWGVSINTADNG